MKRVILAGIALVLVAIAVIASTQIEWGDAAAEEGRVIPVYASAFDHGAESSEAGDACTFFVDQNRFVATIQQIVITDESGSIIAVSEVVGELAESDFTPGELDCRVELNIPVPDSRFYTVRIGDERITTFAEDDFPIDPRRVIMINFD